eukprot:TRINITY_DN37899_c0_g1_i1.p1 TRINITY_DN37899_c0_g1~~TRINITY_DN37899_c0_g1_i1.p1  ORF type:complete len:291 (+),score=114.48 TRINITY_DN37899_c0_g1_i1:46-873(+)
MAARCLLCAVGALLVHRVGGEGEAQPELGDERVVMSTTMGDIELGFFAKDTPLTAAHMLECFRMGLFDSNHVFRVDKGFVAQVADALGGRRLPMNATQTELAKKNVKGEFPKFAARHIRGSLSMARWENPDSATHSFSMVLGTHPGQDNVYALFGRITHGIEVLAKLEELETRKEGIFVMPKERIEIKSTRIYSVKQAAQERFSEVKEAYANPHHGAADGTSKTRLSSASHGVQSSVGTPSFLPAIVMCIAIVVLVIIVASPGRVWRSKSNLHAN